VAVTLVSPAFRHGAPGSEYAFAFYWSGYGHTQAEVLRGMLNPVTHARVLFAHPKPGQMFDLFAGYAFLPFADPVAALCLVLPGWFVLYSSDNPLMNGPILYYGLLILPFLFYATLLGIRRLTRPLGLAARARWTVALAGLVLLIQLGNTRLVQQLSPGAFRRHDRTAAARALIARIPRGAQVSAQAGLVSYVPAASERFALPDGLERSAWALFDTVGVQRSLVPERNRALLARLEGSGAWAREAAEGGFVLLRRRTEVTPPTLPGRRLRD
jgi:hypothetical protein